MWYVWIYYDGKHYDAETPGGVDDIIDLLVFKEWFKDYNHLIPEYKEVNKY